MTTEIGNFLGLPTGEVRDFLSFVDAALEVGRGKGWEGDFGLGHEPRVVVLPDTDGPKHAREF